jgi:hypothetical protein
VPADSYESRSAPHTFGVYIWSMTAQNQTNKETTRWANVTTVVATSVLLTFGVSYYLTYEPSVRIGVRWRDGVTLEHQARLERRFRLVNGAPSETHIRYDLLDTRRKNIEALVNDRNTEDTESVSSTLPSDISYGESWMWVAHRIPGLRAPGVVEVIVMTCVIALVGGVGRLAKSTRTRRRA